MTNDLANIPHRFGTGNNYSTPANSGVIPKYPTLNFLSRLYWGPMRYLTSRVAEGFDDDWHWCKGSALCADLWENIGGRLEIEGMDAMKAKAGPCVFIANHMSTLETFLLPAMIHPWRKITFVVKESLTTMPVFGPVMRSRDPISVGRKNPREDLAKILNEGTWKLRNGISIIIFPQSTRSLYFSRDHFNSMGEKLASRANVPVIPIALKTDAWGQGRKIKELGKIRPEIPARFKFGDIMEISGNGKKEHAQICDFIKDTVDAWQKKDGINL